MLDDALHSTLLVAAVLALGACNLDTAPLPIDVAAASTRDVPAAQRAPVTPVAFAALSPLQARDDDTPITTMETIGASPRD